MVKFVTEWDVRAFGRGLGAAVLALGVVWLVTSASDEGGLTASARAGRTLPVAPLCSAVAAVLALGTARVRQEARALEALGRTPAEATRAAALGAALPSIAIAILITLLPKLDVAAFYPRASAGDQFAWREGAFESEGLGVRVTMDGQTSRIAASDRAADASLPSFARGSASLSTALAGIALAFVAAEATIGDRRIRRRRRTLAIALALGTALCTLVAFQAAAARLVPAVLALVPPAVLFVTALGWRFTRYRDADGG